jgi:hypothetical protein
MAYPARWSIDSREIAQSVQAVRDFWQELRRNPSDPGTEQGAQDSPLKACNEVEIHPTQELTEVNPATT